MSAKKSLTFFVIINKQTDEFILQEGTLLSLKIPKQWQKPHSSVKNPALWVCHLPANSLGIVYISLHPTELVIKKKLESEEKDYEKEFEEYEKELEQYETSKNKENLLVYKGTLEPNSETEKERFYRCRLKLQKKKEEEPKIESSGGGAAVAVFLIIVFVILIIVGVSGGFN